MVDGELLCVKTDSCDWNEFSLGSWFTCRPQVKNFQTFFQEYLKFKTFIEVLGFSRKNNGVTECPPNTSHQEIFADLQGKERQGIKNLKKNGNWKWKEKITKWGEDLWNLFGSTKMGIFYREKAFHARKKKSGKNDFAPSEKYSSYAPEEKCVPVSTNKPSIVSVVPKIDGPVCYFENRLSTFIMAE